MPSNQVPEIVELQCRALLPQNVSLLVAVSGGSDSIALVRLLHYLRARLGIHRLAIIHVNHGLRGKESDDDEQFVRDTAASLQLPLFTKTLAGHALHDTGLEEWARKERYAFFMEVLQKEHFGLVATGHTADDQAETVIFRILRGTGLRGLRGILPLRPDGVVRPLLTLSKGDLIDWLTMQGVGFRTDSSNLNLAYKRNWIRHDIIPEFTKKDPEFIKKLVRVATVSEEVWRAMVPGVETWVEKFAVKKVDHFQIVKKGFTDRLYASEAIRMLFASYGISADSHHIDRILLTAKRTNGEFLLPGGWRYFHERHTILFCMNRGRGTESRISYKITLPGTTECYRARGRVIAEYCAVSDALLYGDNWTVFLDAEVTGSELVYRSSRMDDMFEPLGFGHCTGLPEFLKKQQLPKHERSGYGVLVGKNNQVCWVPGVQIADTCRITAQTKKVLKISYQSYDSTI